MQSAPTAPIRAFQWDLARQAERLDWLIAQLPRYADWGYQELYLHLEDAIEYPSVPGVARGDAYSYRQFAQLVWAATRAGLKVVPIVNLLGHTQYLIKVPRLRDLNECRAPDGSALPLGQICPAHPRTLELAEKLLRDVAPFCTAGKVHVGLDESYHLGRHPLSRAEIGAIGLAGHFAAYVRRLHGLAGGFGLRLGLWADMLALLPSAIPKLPPGVIAYDWYYYPFRRRPRIELRNFTEYDLAAPLRARGIEYWGCPSSGAFRHEPLPVFRERLENIAAWWHRCGQVRAAGMLVTSWEPSRLAAELPMTVEAAAASLWLDGEKNPRRLWELGCRRMFGRRGRSAAAKLWVGDERPFSGGVRWQINDRWDTVLTDEPLHPWRAEARLCLRLARGAGLPPPVGASLRFRAYLAERDLFVREAGQGVWRVRRARARGDEGGARRLLAALDGASAKFSARIAAGRAAAREIRRRTRDKNKSGPNESIVAADASRLRRWRAWLKNCKARPASARRASPVAGAWQLLFTVVHFAPAAQKVVVEQRGAAGAWTDAHGLFLIEFRARAAQPRTRLEYRLSAPIEWEGPPSPPPRLRISARGFGRFKVRDLVLTDGVDHYRAGARPAILGRDAPRSGFPDFDWRKDRDTWEPAFQKRS